MTAADADLATEVTRLRAENAALRQERDAAQRGLSEALEQQTATSDVLRIISRAPRSLQPVFDALVQNARRLCKADGVVLDYLQSDHFTILAGIRLDGTPWPTGEPTPLERVRGLLSVVALRERRTIHAPDIEAEPPDRFPNTLAAARRQGYRTALATPLLRRGEVIGAFFLTRREPHPFTEPQIALLETFADQAVIAIENTRLFEELQESNREQAEALEREQATAEVLRVISQTPERLDASL
jgi:GAF domain-containing protein